MHRTLLVAPPYQRHVRAVAQTTVGAPMGLAYLAGALRESGHEVSVLDANALRLGVEETARRIVNSGATVVGLTATTPTIDLCAAIVARARAKGFAGAALVGGPHPSALPAETLLRHPTLDVAVAGEAEGRIADLVSRARARVSPAAVAAGDTGWREGGLDLAGVGGVAWREDGEIRVELDLPEPPDVATLPRPARDLLPMRAYRSPDSRRAQTVVATRGCPAPCSYCAVPEMFGKAVRRRDPESVADEIEDLIRHWRCDHVNFVDDTFTWDRQWVFDLCDAFVRRGLHRRIRWQCLTRVDRFDGELAARMAAAGCLRVELGIECASEHGLKALRKGVRRRQVVDAFDTAHRAGLQTMALSMVNAPGETPTDVEETWRLIERLDPDQLQVSICTPFPGTRLYDEARASGTLRTEDFSRFRFLREAVFDNGAMTASEAVLAQRTLQRRFWLRPKTFARLAAHAARHPRTAAAIGWAGLQGALALGRRVRQAG